MTINCLEKTKEFKELKTEVFIPFQDKKEEEKEGRKLRELGEQMGEWVGEQIGGQIGGQTINLGQQKTLIKDYPTIHPSNSRDSRDLLNSPIYSINEINTQDVFIRTNFILDTDILDTDNTNTPNTNSNININNNINNNIVENIENTPGDN